MKGPDPDLLEVILKRVKNLKKEAEDPDLDHLPHLLAMIICQLNLIPNLLVLNIQLSHLNLKLPKHTMRPISKKDW